MSDPAKEPDAILSAADFDFWLSLKGGSGDHLLRNHDREQRRRLADTERRVADLTDLVEDFLTTWAIVRTYGAGSAAVNRLRDRARAVLGSETSGEGT